MSRLIQSLPCMQPSARKTKRCAGLIARSRSIPADFIAICSVPSFVRSAPIRVSLIFCSGSAWIRRRPSLTRKSVNLSNFFGELKRRNVYKVAVAYAVVAWLTIQAASIFLPAFNAQQWAMQVVILILVIGFPIALTFSWAFEITPEGIKLESEIEADESITHHTGWKFVALTIVLAVVATGLLIFQFVRARSTSSLSTNASSITNKSIAVLPFDNLSGDPQNAYFSEGVQDE